MIELREKDMRENMREGESVRERDYMYTSYEMYKGRNYRIFNLLVFIQLLNIGRILLQLGMVRVKAPTTT